jgi:hypothetical protein
VHRQPFLSGTVIIKHAPASWVPVDITFRGGLYFEAAALGWVLPVRALSPGCQSQRPVLRSGCDSVTVVPGVPIGSLTALTSVLLHS